MRRYLEKCEEVDGDEEVVVMAEVKRMKMTTTTTTTKVSVSPYNVYELKIRRLRSNDQNETTTFGDDDEEEEEDTVISSSSVDESEVVVVNCSSNLPASSSLSSSCSCSCSSEFVKSCCCHTTTPEVVADLEVESCSETSSKLIHCNKSAREFEAKKLGEPETKGVRKSTVEMKSMTMPSESEIEDFFSSAEKDLQQRFSDKYNYDVVKDVPLEGRYEWVEIKP